MSIASQFWNRLKETPDERRLRKMREARATKAKAPREQTDGIEPEHFEVGLTDGRVITW